MRQALGDYRDYGDDRNERTRHRISSGSLPSVRSHLRPPSASRDSNGRLAPLNRASGAGECVSILSGVLVRALDGLVVFFDLLGGLAFSDRITVAIARLAFLIEPFRAMCW